MAGMTDDERTVDLIHFPLHGISATSSTAPKTGVAMSKKPFIKPPGSAQGESETTGTKYRRVTTADLLRAVMTPRRADDVGADLWPHLHGRGPSRGGPDACYVTAARMLGKLRNKGLVRQWFPSKYDHRWQITAAGREFLAD